MKVEFFKQSRINSAYLDAIKNSVDDMGSAKYKIISGTLSETFERNFSSYLGCSDFVYTSNGLDSLILALKALGIGHNDDVIVPCHTYIATWIAPLTLGCRIIAAPVTNDNFLLDTSLLGRYITSRTKCIMPVHLYGNPCAMEEITDFARKFNLLVVEDAAQAHGAYVNQKKIGSWGDLTCFSFYPTKNLGAMGEAGGIALNDSALAVSLKSYRNYGRDLADGASNIYLGGNCRGDELQASFLDCKLKSIAFIIQQRKYFIEIYRRELDSIKRQIRLIPYQSGSSPHLAVAVLSNCTQRDNLIKYLNDHQIQSSIHYKVPCHLQPFIHKDQMICDSFCQQQAISISNAIISLPLSEAHTTEEILYVCSTIKNFFDVV